MSAAEPSPGETRPPALTVLHLAPGHAHPDGDGRRAGGRAPTGPVRSLRDSKPRRAAAIVPLRAWEAAWGRLEAGFPPMLMPPPPTSPHARRSRSP